MEMQKNTNTNLERNILKNLFHTVVSLSQVDNTISDSKIIRDTKNQLRNALRGVIQRCTCAKRTWGGPCEVCQASDREIVELRNFFRVIRNAKKHSMSEELIQEFISNTKERINLSDNKH